MAAGAGDWEAAAVRELQSAYRLRHRPRPRRGPATPALSACSLARPPASAAATTERRSAGAHCLRGGVYGPLRRPSSVWPGGSAAHGHGHSCSASRSVYRLAVRVHPPPPSAAAVRKGRSSIIRWIYSPCVLCPNLQEGGGTVLHEAEWRRPAATCATKPAA